MALKKIDNARAGVREPAGVCKPVAAAVIATSSTYTAVASQELELRLLFGDEIDLADRCLLLNLIFDVEDRQKSARRRGGRLARRNETFRHLAAAYYATVKPYAAGLAIERDLNRFARPNGLWHRVKNLSGVPLSMKGTRDEFFFRIMTASGDCGLPGAKRITQILQAADL